jgi:hypothetical protein
MNVAVRTVLLSFFLFGVSVAARLVSAELAFRSQTAGRAVGILGSAPKAEYVEGARGLQSALETNARFTHARIRLGLAQEVAGEISAAERTLLEAARWDRQYLPAWTLANFYYRRENPDQFWEWAARAAELCYDDSRPLLRLAASLPENKPGEKSATGMLERLHGGDRVTYAYLDFLIGEGRLDAAQEVGRVLLRDSARNRDRLEALAARQSEAKNAEWAKEIRDGVTQSKASE